MTVFLVPNRTKPAVMKTVALAAGVLASEGVKVIVSAEHRPLLPQDTLTAITFCEEEEAYAACDIVATIGGDGTMLHTARHTILCQKPMIGINMGRLGFLTIVELGELHELRRLARGEYTVEHRSVLQADCSGEEPFSGFALNDVVLFKESADRTIELDIYCDNIKVSSFRGDGMVFATPTGSTAYSMSAGGPVLDAQLGGIVATQICAHIVHTPPMVFSGERVLRAVPRGDETEKVCITCDGQPSRRLSWGEPVFIKQSALTVPLIQFSDAGQLKSIDKKLKGR